MPTTTDLIGLAIEKNPVEFASAIDDILRQKQEAALEATKIELAKSVYGNEDPIEDEDEIDFDSDDTADDITYDDDLDIDLEDLDLDELDLDLDLEDIGDDNEDA